MTIRAPMRRRRYILQLLEPDWRPRRRSPLLPPLCAMVPTNPNFYTLASFFMEFFSSFSGFPQSTMVSSRLFVPFPNVHLLLVLNLVGLVCLQFLKLSETRSNIILITYISCSYRYFKDTGVVVGLVFSHFLPFHVDANSLLCQVFHSSFPPFLDLSLSTCFH